MFTLKNIKHSKFDFDSACRQIDIARYMECAA